MTETPKCPYCGAELEVTHAFVSDATAAHKLVYTCFCRECGVYTPKRSTPEEALSAALHRAEPEMRPLTREEVEALCADGIDAMPLWVEYKHVPDISRWMCVDAPEHFSTWETIKILIREHGKNYGETRRCWPRKPTPEQMAAWKWEEDITNETR